MDEIIKNKLDSIANEFKNGSISMEELLELYITDIEGRNSNKELIVHLPSVELLEDNSFEILGGRIEKLSFEEFKILDNDWARQKYFSQSKATVWRINIESEDERKILDNKVRLIQLAICTICVVPLPNVDASITYIKGDGSVAREIGVFGRTAFLKNFIRVNLDIKILDEIKKISEQWERMSLKAYDPVFNILNSFSTIYTELSTEPGLQILPVITEMEGTFAPTPGTSIAVRMSKNMLKIYYTDELEKIIKKIYNLRSDIMHGRKYNLEKADELCSLTNELVCKYSIEFINSMETNDFTFENRNDFFEGKQK